VIRAFRALALLFPVLLTACGGQSSSSSPAVVTGFSAAPGDSEVTLSWDSHPDQIYTLYYKSASTVSVADYDDVIVPVTSPYVVTSLTNNFQYSFMLTATNPGSIAGPPSPIITAVPGAGGGIAWTIGTSLSASALLGAAYGNSNFVAVGGVVPGGSIPPTPVVYTANASNTNTGGVGVWTKATTLPSGLATTLSSIVYDGSHFVVLGSSGDVLTSTDTLVWGGGTSIAVPIGGVMTAIAYGAGTYVAVGTGGEIATTATAPPSQVSTSSGSQPVQSPWNAVWTMQNPGTTQDLNGVSYVNGVFVAVGAGGTLLTSPRGVNWTARTTNTTKDLWQVAYGAGNYVAVGSEGTVLSSSDSASWQLQTSPTTQGLYAICFGSNSKFIAVGDAGTIVSSDSGTNGSWSVATVGSADLYGIASGGTLVAVGKGGATVSGQ
jgi:hypothetical protein